MHLVLFVVLFCAHAPFVASFRKAVAPALSGAANGTCNEPASSFLPLSGDACAGADAGRAKEDALVAFEAVGEAVMLPAVRAELEASLARHPALGLVSCAPTGPTPDTGQRGVGLRLRPLLVLPVPLKSDNLLSMQQAARGDCGNPFFVHAATRTSGPALARASALRDAGVTNASELTDLGLRSGRGEGHGALGVGLRLWEAGWAVAVIGCAHLLGAAGSQPLSAASGEASPPAWGASSTWAYPAPSGSGGPSGPDSSQEPSEWSRRVDRLYGLVEQRNSRMVEERFSHMYPLRRGPSERPARPPPLASYAHSGVTVVVMTYKSSTKAARARRLLAAMAGLDDGPSSGDRSGGAGEPPLVREVVLLWNADPFADQWAPPLDYLAGIPRSRVVLAPANDLQNRMDMALVRPETACVLALDDDTEPPSRAALKSAYDLWAGQAEGTFANVGLAESRGPPIAITPTASSKQVLSCAPVVAYVGHPGCVDGRDWVVVRQVLFHAHWASVYLGDAHKPLRDFVRAQPSHPDDLAFGSFVNWASGQPAYCSDKLQLRRLDGGDDGIGGDGGDGGFDDGGDHDDDNNDDDNNNNDDDDAVALAGSEDYASGTRRRLGLSGGNAWHFLRSHGAMWVLHWFGGFHSHKGCWVPCRGPIGSQQAERFAMPEPRLQNACLPPPSPGKRPAPGPGITSVGLQGGPRRKLASMKFMGKRPSAGAKAKQAEARHSVDLGVAREVAESEEGGKGDGQTAAGAGGGPSFVSGGPPRAHGPRLLLSVLYGVSSERDVLSSLGNLLLFSDSGTVIVAHLSRGSPVPDPAPRSIARLSPARVFVNPERGTTAHATGTILRQHVSNFAHAASTLRLAFDSVMVLPSNTRFVLHGAGRLAAEARFSAHDAWWSHSPRIQCRWDHLTSQAGHQIFAIPGENDARMAYSKAMRDVDTAFMAALDAQNKASKNKQPPPSLFVPLSTYQPECFCHAGHASAFASAASPPSNATAGECARLLADPAATPGQLAGCRFVFPSHLPFADALRRRFGRVTWSYGPHEGLFLPADALGAFHDFMAANTVRTWRFIEMGAVGGSPKVRHIYRWSFADASQGNVSLLDYMSTVHAGVGFDAVEEVYLQTFIASHPDLSRQYAASPVQLPVDGHLPPRGYDVGFNELLGWLLGRDVSQSPFPLSFKRWGLGGVEGSERAAADAAGADDAAAAKAAGAPFARRFDTYRPSQSLSRVKPPPWGWWSSSSSPPPPPPPPPLDYQSFALSPLAQAASVARALNAVECLGHDPAKRAAWDGEPWDVHDALLACLAANDDDQVEVEAGGSGGGYGFMGHYLQGSNSSFSSSAPEGDDGRSGRGWGSSQRSSPRGGGLVALATQVGIYHGYMKSPPPPPSTAPHRTRGAREVTGMFLAPPPMSLRPVGAPLRLRGPARDARDGKAGAGGGRNGEAPSSFEAILSPGPREAPFLRVFRDFQQGALVTADLAQAQVPQQVVGAPRPPPGKEGAGVWLVDLGAWVQDLRAHRGRVHGKGLDKR